MATSADVRLSRNFRLAEFVGSCGAPLPPGAVVAVRALVIHSLQPLRTRFGATTVWSGCRSERHNQQVGGAPRSYHLYRLRDWRFAAADVSCASGEPEDWAAFLEACRTRGVGTYVDHVHADNRSGRQTVWRG